MALYKVRLSHIYRKLLYIFLIACAILVVFIVFIVFNKATISVKANDQIMKVDFPVNIVAGASENSAMSIPGRINDVIIEKEKEFNATGTRAAEGDIVGSVTLINNFTKDQPLVATTRLLTPDNVLLRIKDSVTVPAGGSVKANVYADDSGSFNEIQPTTFTIPGLWEGLQDKIYAESSAIIKNNAGEIKYVRKKDIEQAREELTQALYAQVESDFADNAEQGILVIDNEILQEEISAQPDDVVDSFNMKLKMKVMVVMFEKEKLYPLAGERLMAEMTPGFKLSNMDLEKFTYTIESYDEEKETVSVKVHAEGNVKLDENGAVLDKQKLMGLTSKGAELYLTGLPEIEEAEVKLSPFWVRTVPDFEDHINIEIVE